MNLSALLSQQQYILLDGAMGTMLQQHGMQPGAIPEFLNMTDPQMLVRIHKAYLESGSQIIYANTFGANRFKLEGSGYTVEQVVAAAIQNVRTAIQEANADGNAYAALDLGPLGKLLEPSGPLSFDEAYDCYKELVIAGVNAGADLVVIETMTDLLEAKAALLAVKENSDLPVLVTMTFEQNRRTFTGVSIASMALTLEGLGADAIGVNCSLGPNELYPIVEELARWTTLPMIVKPNAGLPDPVTNHYHVSPEEFAAQIQTMAALGVRIFGGCCGTNPDYIRAVKNILAQTTFPAANTSPKVIPAAVCSASRVVEINQPRVIGERINPTGKKKFKEALRNHDMNYILNQALEQVHAGADILDVNVGLPEIDEKAMMVSAVKSLQGIVDVPLQIDSTVPEVLEAALRVYNGKPIVNSVNGEAASMEAVLPLVKKYGAAVVCLTLDDTGIPPKAEQRFAIAQRILCKALELGIPKQDIYIDCLTLTASAEQEAVMETVKAVQMVKEQLGLKTVLGVSNISFGLPNRELINQTFLSMALHSGLDLPIINPNVASMMGTVRAHKLLTNVDKNATQYIEAYANYVAPVAAATASATTASGSAQANTAGSTPATSGNANPTTVPEKLLYAIENGLAEDGAACTTELLQTMDAMEIIDQYLIPALDTTGSRFEKGTIFLPQLILSANAAQACFGVIKEHFAKANTSPVSKGKIILATVKGDIHDIGKNIVKVLLENYSYEVIDLGRDVDPELIVQTAIEQQVTLVGLSALMTTTLKSMEDTIALLHERKVPCEIMVGGAVLTPEYAEKIHADFYAKDAKESVDIARRHFGQ